MKCPRCGSEDVFVQNVQTGSTSTGKVVMREPRKKGCLYWLCFGWCIDLVYFMMLSRLVDTFFSRTSWTMLLYAENHSISVA